MKRLVEPPSDGLKEGIGAAGRGPAGSTALPVLRFAEGRLSAVEHSPVREFPLKLIVNGRELATLIASPHDLRFLVAGFLRLQGFVTGVADFQMFSVCEDMGVANVRIDRELPERLTPVL